MSTEFGKAKKLIGKKVFERQKAHKPSHVKKIFDVKVKKKSMIQKVS